MKYLYGASVQGIQEIIFETNKLKEISGASTIIENICKDFLQKFFPDLKGLPAKNFIIRAAGNIRFVCDDEQIVKTIVKRFPMEVAKELPGITVSQAVMKLENGLEKGSLRELDAQLKIQRNCRIKTAPVGLSVAKRAPRTGKPACERKGRGEDSELIDFATAQKQNSKANDRFQGLLFEGVSAVNGVSLCLPKSEDDISDNAKKNWIAICHADGNGLGQVLIDIEEAVQGKTSQQIQEAYCGFSDAIEKANEKALKEAFDDVVVADAHKTIDKKKLNSGKFFVPFRPILLGGDDITFICRADLAVPFLQKYMACFEKYTQENFIQLSAQIPALKKGLTICAGVAFIKKNYPFHYGYDLAEDLCSYSKRVSKKNKDDNGNTPSSLAFHKVHSSFHAGYENIAENELQIGETSLQFGPYAINNDVANMPCLDDLLLCVEELQKSDAPKSGLRKWIAELENHHIAQQLLCRTADIAREKQHFSATKFSKLLQQLNTALTIDKLIVNDTTPVNDLLTLTSLG